MLPAPGRIAAGLLAALLAAGLLALVNGPWLRVAQVAWAGDRYTPTSELQRAVAELDGTPLLTVDATGLSADLARLPAIAEARVAALLPDRIQITIVEKVAAFVWQTSAVRLVGVADGTLIGQVALRAELPDDLAGLPLIDDRRLESRDIIVGDVIDPATLAAALRLSQVEAAQLGSAAAHLDVRLTDDDGFLLVADAPAWEADFGFYPDADAGRAGTLEERVEAQLAAMRTLFSFEREGEVRWVDVRDPRRVYWRP